MVSQEMACDALALEMTSTGDAEYGRMLVKFAAEPRGRGGQLMMVGIAESTQDLRRRLVAMAHATRLTRRRLVLVGLSVGVLAAAALVPGRPSARPALGLTAGTAWAQGGGGAVAGGMGGGMRGPVEETPSVAGSANIEAAGGVWTKGSGETGVVPIEGRMLISGYKGLLGNLQYHSYFLEGTSDNVITSPLLLNDGDLSPSGDRVAYDLLPRTWPFAWGQICEADSEGSNVGNLSMRAGLGGVNCMPAWSPDGSMIAFQHAEPEAGQQPCEAGQSVWVMNADGTGARQVTPAVAMLPTREGGLREALPEEGCPTKDRFARWSPDGARIIYGTYGGSATIKLDGTDIMPVPGLRGVVDWSPDGSKLVASSSAWEMVDGEPGEWRQLVVADADGSNRRVLVQQLIRASDIEAHLPGPTNEGASATEMKDMPWSVGPYFPKWSPQGDRIAFLAALPFDPEGPWYKEQVEVWIYELATKKLTKITDDSGADMWLSWR